jgi:glycosyltransferase involved in cell wall biosynthesis
LRIAQLSPTYETVPPPAYGGTELVVSLITEELVRRGHDLTLFATGDSTTAARLVSVTDQPYRYGEGSQVRHPEWIHMANAQACFRAAAEGAFDVVHNHAGVEGMILGATSATPVLTTNHLAFAPETQPVWDAFPWYHNAASASSGSTFPGRGQLAPIHHGLDVESFPFRDRSDGYLLFLGRFSPDKGPDVAIEVAERTGRRLLLAGKIDAIDEAFYAEAVEPALDGDRIRFIGEADAEEKRRLLGGADALLFPIRWDEPFGLVMIEAMACGTPVIGFRRASVPEVIDPGTTGFVVDDADTMVDAVGHIGLIDRRRCRDEAERRFSVRRMVDDYERAYEAVIERGPLPRQDVRRGGSRALAMAGASQEDASLRVR